MKANLYLSRYGIDGLKNGSLYRTTGRKREPFAQYMNGDFMGFVTELPATAICCIYTRKDAKFYLPECMR